MPQFWRGLAHRPLLPNPEESPKDGPAGLLEHPEFGFPPSKGPIPNPSQRTNSPLKKPLEDKIGTGSALEEQACFLMHSGNHVV